MPREFPLELTESRGAGRPSRSEGFHEHTTVAEGFFENVRQVESLIQMPLLMFSMMEVQERISRRYEPVAVPLAYWTTTGEFQNFWVTTQCTDYESSPRTGLHGMRFKTSR